MTNSRGTRWLVIFRAWASPIFVVVGLLTLAALLCAFVWVVAMSAERECTEMCDTIGMSGAVRHANQCYCVDEQGRARPWPERPEDEECSR